MANNSLDGDINRKEVNSVSGRRVEMFFSFDIVGFSDYKNINVVSWHSIMISVFRAIEKEVEESSAINEATLWRIVGDEMIFVSQIHEASDFIHKTNAVLLIMESLIQKIENGKIVESDDVVLKEKIKQPISLRGAAWIAIIVDGMSLEKLDKYDNIYMEYTSVLSKYGLDENSKRSIVEYQGPDIDAGFRIKQENYQKRLVISYELAYMIMNNSDNAEDKKKAEENIHIMAYKSLKGIWSDLMYPIIWYHNPDCIRSRTLFEDSFTDDEKNNPLVVGYFQGKNDPLVKNKYETDALADLLKYRRLESKIDKINVILKSSSIFKLNKTETDKNK